MGAIQYAPLDPSKREIRLIELLPRATNNSSQSELAPRCNLIYVSLEDKPDYVALSYTWGDPQDAKLITVGHSSVAVTRNLCSALEHLQSDNTVRFMWIDALCINQLDGEEKSWQIQLMSEIYQRASFVCIWLGPADKASEQDMEYLRQFGTKAMSFGLDEGPEVLKNVTTQWKKLACHPASFRDTSTERVIVKSSKSSIANKEFLIRDLNELYYSISGSHEQDNLLPVEGIANLFTRSWWSRTWVWQEVSLAQRAAFVCGTKWLSRRRCTAALNAFKALSSALEHMLTFKGATLTSYQSSVALSHFEGRPTILLGAWNITTQFPLLSLLEATCIGTIETHNVTRISHLEATDPRDKIYGLLGLAADRDKLKELGIQPDYTQSCQDLYTCFMAMMLRQGNLSVLSLNQFPKAQVGLPSWVPDWSKPLRTPLQAIDTGYTTLVPEYNASGSLVQTKPCFSSFGATKSVSVSGFVYDEVYDVGVTWAEFRLKDSKSPQTVPARRLLIELIRLSFLQAELYKNDKERIRATARTATAEMGLSDNDRWGRIGNQRYYHAASLLMTSINDPDETKFADARFLGLIKSELVKSGGLQLATDRVFRERYIGEIEAIASCRKPFVTVKGHLGLGPDHIELGDMIALLIGCQVPFVLRKSIDGKYEIVGEAYVDGIMDGEAAVGCESVGAVELC